jgi:short-subunit dehydrogenase
MAGKSVIITGASSGIGRALAFEFAKKGYALGLTARRYELLKTLQQELTSQFGKELSIELRVLDVTIYRDVYRILKELNYALGGMNILVVNAGVAGSRKVGSGNFQVDKNIIETNVIGAIACVDAGIEILKSQKKSGQIVGISSLAGLRGFPGNASYCASKAAFTTYLEGARLEVEGDDISITTVLPGFIDTNMNKHMKERPFLISVEEGARKIFKAIEKKKKLAVVPNWPWRILMYLVPFIPSRFLSQRVPKKNSQS